MAGKPFFTPRRRACNGVVPGTGQRHCYDEMGVEIPCPGSGQGNEQRRGVEWPEPRFDATCDTVLDHLTSKCWTRLADIVNEAVTWAEALSAIQRLNSQSRHDAWRLPNINELESLVDCDCATPALPVSHPFHGTQDVYWSSTTSLYEPGWAWALYLEKGQLVLGIK